MSPGRRPVFLARARRPLGAGRHPGPVRAERPGTARTSGMRPLSRGLPGRDGGGLGHGGRRPFQFSRNTRPRPSCLSCGPVQAVQDTQAEAGLSGSLQIWEIIPKTTADGFRQPRQGRGREHRPIRGPVGLSGGGFDLSAAR
jgi:hypothetical protein